MSYGSIQSQQPNDVYVNNMIDSNYLLVGKNPKQIFEYNGSAQSTSGSTGENWQRMIPSGTDVSIQEEIDMSQSALLCSVLLKMDRAEDGSNISMNFRFKPHSSSENIFGQLLFSANGGRQSHMSCLYYYYLYPAIYSPMPYSNNTTNTIIQYKTIYDPISIATIKDLTNDYLTIPGTTTVGATLYYACYGGSTSNPITFSWKIRLHAIQLNYNLLA